MIQLTLTLKTTTTQVVETIVTVNNSPIQDYVDTIMLDLLTSVSDGLSSKSGGQRETRKEKLTKKILARSH